MIAKDSMAHAWANYYLHILRPSGVVPASTQYIETRRAFYAGAAAMFCSVMGATDLPDDQAEQTLNGLQKELEDFGTAVGKTT